MVIGLRFIEKDGKKMLQMQRKTTHYDGGNHPYTSLSEWEDVPFVEPTTPAAE